MTQKYPKVAGYELTQQIGGGGFSTVWRATNFAEQRVAACKVIVITENTTETERKTIEKEMRVHMALKHEHVLEFLNALVVDLKHKQRYVPGIYMLLELAAGGDLFDKIAPEVGVGDEVAHYYFSQLISGMDYIHSQGVCHRDIKPENILLDIAGNLKISDFGLCAVYKLKDTGKIRTLTERCGSLPYVAPELAGDAPYQAEPIDVWGIGVILFTLLAGNTPWDEPTTKSPEYMRYLSGKIFSDPPWNRMGNDALSLIRGMLTVDPEERLTLAQVFQHHWCARPSQLAGQSASTLAERLTQSLKQNGDLEYATPPVVQDSDHMDTDEDQIMLSANPRSQFTQSLMLFSQTQGGSRYTPHLTRFYANVAPFVLMELIRRALENFKVQYRERPAEQDKLLLRVGGHDARKVTFKGWITVESFNYKAIEGSFCVMQRDEGNPISWRQLWKALVQSEAVSPHVLRK